MNKSAREMFEELGYRETENDIYFLKYYKPCKLQKDKEIKFHKLRLRRLHMIKL